MSSTPRYRAIADDLSDKIRSGRYRAGEALPAQRELSASYGVTMMTLRQALQVLSAEGLIDQRAGRGTYVARPGAEYPLDTLRSLGDDLRRQGHPLRTEVVSAALRPAPRSLTPLLGDVRALRLTRVRHLRDRPVVHQVSWVAEPHASAVRGADFTEVPLYTALTEAGARIHRAAERIRPALLTAPVAARLNRPPGGPVFVSERVTYDDRGTPIVVDHATILGEWMEIRAERKATDLSLHWTDAFTK
ncbi:GntR family transcriptional regulator [Herbidospora daliensis]|uniref:GntR family transcriptional regulator n=1 Tax=Herbidospora daliensis TaxID=295585 RepID=UPI0007850FC4|nr:GntR family transcriptional regulator [Herbidospora daliensis]